MSGSCRPSASVFILALTVLSLCALGGCASGPSFGVALETTPSAPIPDKPITLKVTLSGADSSGAAVKVVVGGKSFTVARTEAGVFVTDKLVLPGVGAHTVDVNVTVDGDTTTYSATLTAACGTGGGAGAACCAADACGANLTCVYGACSVTAGAAAARCHGASECGSGICADGVCAAATCDDKVKNGTEASVDCGGTCGPCKLGATCSLGADCEGGACCGGTCGTCAIGEVCTQDTDCTAGLCAMGRCPLEAGKLIGTNDPATNKAKITEILSDGMSAPSDLAFSTLDPNQLWVVDAPTDSFIVIFGPGKEAQSHNIIRDFSQHFMEKVMAISFSDEPSFGTCGDSRNDYGGQAKPNNFMGPVQWPSNYNDYTSVNSAHAVHWDMLHSSPYCMGMASTGGTGYYTFNGYDSAIDWVDFNKPHCPGCDDHSDGEKRRFLGLSVKRVANVPSNLVYDSASSWLYVADSGNGRVIRLDSRNSVATKNIPAFMGDGTLKAYSAPVVQTLKATGLKMPSGLALDRGVLYVGDAETGVITAWKIDGPGANGEFGMQVATLKTGFKPGALVGLTVGPDRKLYAIDRVGKRVVRVDP